MFRLNLTARYQGYQSNISRISRPFAHRILWAVTPWKELFVVRKHHLKCFSSRTFFVLRNFLVLRRASRRVYMFSSYFFVGKNAFVLCGGKSIAARHLRWNSLWRIGLCGWRIKEWPWIRYCGSRPFWPTQEEWQNELMGAVLSSMIHNVH